MTRRLCLAVTTLAGILAASCHESTPPRFAEAPPLQDGPRGGPSGGPLAPVAAPSNVSFAIAQSPLALTASDGTGLKLAELRAEAIIEGPLAFTELHLTFENPLDRQLEGTFRITLPQGASLGRFAMKIGGEWQEGEVVELAEARRAYEDFLHRKQDPALMEKSAGNEFSARVFPIPARGTKEIVVAYMHEINDGQYKLPLRGLPELGVLDVKAKVIGAHAEAPRLSLQRGAPQKDYVVDVDALLSADKSAKFAPNRSGVRSGELAILRIKPATTAQPEPIASALVLVDTSASRVLGFEDEVKLVERLVKRLAQGQATVTVAAFDQTVAPIFEGRAADFGEKDLAKLRERGALGASDLEHALVWAREQAKKGAKKRVVLVTDGVATAGATDSKKLAAEVARLRESGVERIDALAIGGIRDDVGLTRLVRGQLAHDGIVVDPVADESAALRRLGEATRSNVAVRIEGATWAWPTKLDGVQAGDAYSIYAQIPAGRPVKLSIDGKTAEIIDLRETGRPLVERGVAQAKIASMLEREATSKDDLKKSIVSLAVQQRIMTPYTAMLVLETEQDYARFHIDRKSLIDVLAVQDGAVKRVHRTSIAMPLAVATKAPQETGGGDEDRDGVADSSDGRDKDEAKKSVQMQPGRVGAGGGGQPSSSTPPRTEVAGRPPLRGVSPEAARPSASSGGVVGGFAGGVAHGAAAPPAMAAPPPMAPSPASPRPSMAPRVAAEAPRDDRPRPPSAAPAPPPPPPPQARASRPMVVGEIEETRQGSSAAPYEGQFAIVMAKIAAKNQKDEALATARAWQKESPGDVLALVALGEAAEAENLMELAARAYGSVVDLFPNRADLRRFAGERLERLKDAPATALAIDSFRKAVADRPDHPSSHRLLAFALLRDKQFEKAFEAALTGVKQGYEVDRFRGVERILREDLGLVGAAWAHAEPLKRDQILARIRAAGGRIEDAPSLRFVLDWQTDANDVDFHIHDAQGGHAYYSAPHLQSGGDLYADVTTGYGPECFTIRLPKSKRSTYQLEAHYYSRGPMGYGMGKLEVIDHDGNGNLTFEERPFIVMVDSAFVDLGTVKP